MSGPKQRLITQQRKGQLGLYFQKWSPGWRATSMSCSKTRRNGEFRPPRSQGCSWPLLDVSDLDNPVFKVTSCSDWSDVLRWRHIKFFLMTLHSSIPFTLCFFNILCRNVTVLWNNLILSWFGKKKYCIRKSSVVFFRARELTHRTYEMVLKAVRPGRWTVSAPGVQPWQQLREVVMFFCTEGLNVQWVKIQVKGFLFLP